VFPFSPVIIYGNSYFGSAGGHNYAATGAIYCDEILKQNGKCGFRGLYRNDSILNSPAYPTPDFPDLRGLGWAEMILRLVKYNIELSKTVGGHALLPNQFYAIDELEDFWKKTGLAIPWEKSIII
jgi:hypothetical protein